MRVELVTLFPEVSEHLRYGLLAKAIDSGLLRISALSPREFTRDRHRSVDDAPYGGGAGMVLSPGPIIASLEALDERRGEPSRRILVTPQGRPFTQRVAEDLAAERALTFVCGRYEGFDERIRGHVHDELSLGDFVLLGGESAALTMIEATVRLIPGVLGNAASADEESFAAGLLEHPQYTRPAEFRGERVPDVLLSGHHAAIRRWRRRESLRRTRERRPELLARAELSAEDQALLEELDREPS
ncbi:MAG: tRNA (guanosine(37)-N1)-methyltransferase TrmD [Myxococcota bacterium]